MVPPELNTWLALKKERSAHFSHASNRVVGLRLSSCVDLP